MLLKVLAVTALTLVVIYLVNMALYLGFHLHYKKHQPGKCSRVKGLDYGSEDFQVTTDGLAFVTSGVSFSVASSGYKDFIAANKVKGRIVLFDFNKPEAGVTELKVRPSPNFNPDTFRPHGISLLEDSRSKQHLLYVVSHPDNLPDRVEKFRFLPETGELEHVKFFTDEKFFLLNDLAVVAEDQFYVSNMNYFTSHNLALAEAILPLNLATVVFFDGTKGTDVITGVTGPNGVTLSTDKRYVYVNFPFLYQMRVYERKGDNSLTLVQTLDLFTGPDNIHLSLDGKSLYLGCHPVFHKAMSHLDNPNLRAPSSVLKVPLVDGLPDPDDITEEFYDHGDVISASSIAAVYNNRLLIGSVIDKLVVCECRG
ncbi:serum paraoxonase/arylesterase 2-like [Physella acuta]|uniref:serum paraoxonase/arylesterase 2-like n=1 Tax=Physella acuta TaxID=109671 RepID=UPI0027DD7F6F|nr:serum paraoxonase/arylesterase 2-like [Physella acuta]XP_059173118.1 serum paraoxonase/arylesterase 2-like [Physella acuta]XP_059173119.1 serum paraoxonase/arylesterase 2-like [Physella acuta]XP_059173120.1 serum paraoxonase/arylesterase 2-like [Physella acuta]